VSRSILVPSLVLPIAIALASCGGGEDGAPQSVDAAEYARVVVGADSLFWRDLNQANSEFARAGPQTVSAERAFGVFAVLAARYADTLAGVRPPATLAEVHDTYTATLTDMASDFADASRGRSQVSFAEVLASEPDLEATLDAANARVRDGCTGVERALGVSGQLVGLRCDSFR
jgi:hypothetical protein